MKIAIYTLGCKVNQYETQAMERLLRARGHEIVDFSAAADAYVVNSCSVTAVSDQKSRQALHKIRRERPGAALALCGCYAQTHPEDMEGLDVDLVAGTGDRMGFIALLEKAAEERARVTAIDRAFDRREFEVLPAGGLEERTRAMLKVEDGCVNFCSYCIIPYARGPVRSLPPERAAEQAAALAAAGYREIVLTGIEISSWGADLKNGLRLVDLIETVCAAAPGVRIRLGSLEPRTVTEDFCRRCAALPDLCPQFHLSLQSGCDETLRRMNRKYGATRYLQSVELLNRYFGRPALTTDLIAGFPEETEEEFAETLDFIRKCGFARMHIFPYSVRPGTPAAKMAQVPKAVKAERARRASAAAEEMRASYLQGCVGETYSVLFEQPKEGRFSGHAPNYMEVLAGTAEAALHNQLRNVRITGTDGEILTGEILED
ncbi:tRNA (N(6)-L-threonylcarbamoyladenosine(37)-C(2))-methylthiotransferase MtaB [Oscillibacter sp. 1-3]|uniref:tRNA (N(6)-L-threonylcarbamoyladenosine(37)-C(2))- methylthiotransferase MtaB n=1 Tax=Oscillibacter sp. 1-3 TaxID=1235797 RepID=UPI000337CB50|nr:tRNA (N(6)-L-threonylcarbamoyladenosine(37)-C(2))-methylthiotransferase MtaB [Oscillibacter sp. 1-3]EOS66344.1 MiaB-like tRNA modifying enzyme [Oscillibacter sp. 1-3]